MVVLTFAYISVFDCSAYTFTLDHGEVHGFHTASGYVIDVEVANWKKMTIKNSDDNQSY